MDDPRLKALKGQWHQENISSLSVMTEGRRNDPSPRAEKSCRVVKRASNFDCRATIDIHGATMLTGNERPLLELLRRRRSSGKNSLSPETLPSWPSLPVKLIIIYTKIYSQFTESGLILMHST
jgi:hypothetical protein